MTRAEGARIAVIWAPRTSAPALGSGDSPWMGAAPSRHREWPIVRAARRPPRPVSKRTTARVGVRCREKPRAAANKRFDHGSNDRLGYIEDPASHRPRKTMPPACPAAFVRNAGIFRSKDKHTDDGPQGNTDRQCKKDAVLAEAMQLGWPEERRAELDGTCCHFISPLGLCPAPKED